jgi:predicted AAA+ superfamily ATPase
MRVFMMQDNYTKQNNGRCYLMNKNISAIYRRLTILSYGLCLFKKISSQDIYKSLQKLLKSMSAAEPNLLKITEYYHDFSSLAIENNWPELLLDVILDEDNKFSRDIALYGMANITPSLRQAAVRDFKILQELSTVSARKVKASAQQIFSSNLVDNDLICREETGITDLYNQNIAELVEPESWPEWDDSKYKISLNIETIPDIAESITSEKAGNAQLWLQTERNKVKNYIRESKCWSEVLDKVAHYYLKVGTGIFSKDIAWRWQSGINGGYLKGIPEPDPFSMEELIGLEQQINIIIENTEHFLQGYAANNVLLYGDRGTGKSSVIKALLNKYVHNGLRLIELAKSDFGDLPQVMQVLRVYPQRFIIFTDDLSFEENEREYKILKTFLEGTLDVRPQNVVVYATSNRRHLIREGISERDGQEIHARDSIEEKLSLADRFGITVTFTSPNQKEFLNIVDGLISRRQLCCEQNEVHQSALLWQMWHNGLSGRTAKQFVDHLTAQISRE